MSDQREKFGRILGDQRWKREKLKKKLKSPISEDEMSRVEDECHFKFPPLLRYLLSKSKVLYMVNSCTGLFPYEIEFTHETLKEFDDTLCLRIAFCGCTFETWVQLTGAEKVFEAIGENIIERYPSLEIYFETYWRKMSRFED